MTPLECEITGSKEPFSALCVCKNQEVNSIVELAQAAVTDVVKQGPVVFPSYYFLAVCFVFLEYVRCRFGKKFNVRTIHDALLGKPGDLLVHTATELFFLCPIKRKFIGPYDNTNALLAAWISSKPQGVDNVFQ